MIRDAIRERIKDLDVTQKQVCDEIEVTTQTFSGFLNGRLTLPFDKFVNVLDVLGLTVGARGETVGTIPPQCIRSAVRTQIKQHIWTIAFTAQQAHVNASVLSSFLSGKRTMNVNTLDRLLTTLKMELVSYGEPKVKRLKNQPID